MDQAFAPGTEAALKGRGGLRAKILTNGILRVENPRAVWPNKSESRSRG
jgi:hypothetical protein